MSFIRISNPEASADEPRRLNAYAGRYLSEREFELLQAYTDDRIKPLTAGLTPGIVQGLQLRVDGTILNIQPGTAVGAGGRLIRLFYPLQQDWDELVTLVERLQDAPLRDGFYLLTLRDVVEEVDQYDIQQACTRTELDPTRERRLETVILPGLRFISANPRLMNMSQARAANRLCVRFLQESPHDATGAVPIALLKVEAKQATWIDTVAGRYLSEPDSAYRTFLAHSVTQLEQGLNRTSDRPTGPIMFRRVTPTLSQLLGLDFLPAAGPLPSAVLINPASKTPRLAFNPADLQVELAPVPASTITGVIEQELPRGTINLVHGLGDRLRLLLAIPDLDYRPDLMDLPQRDTALERELFQREQAASQAWADWWTQWQRLFGGLSSDKLNAAPKLVNRPMDGESYRSALIAQRRAQMPNQQAPLPEPYASHLLSPYVVTNYQFVASPAAPEEQLLLQQDNLTQNIQDIEQDLDESYRLLNEMNDYLNLQRQQLDNLTISFSTLAGGVAGDGTGESMMRWNGAVAFDPTVKK